MKSCGRNNIHVIFSKLKNGFKFSAIANNNAQNNTYYIPVNCEEPSLPILAASVVDPNSLFSVSDQQIFFRVRIFILIFLPEIFKNGASQCFYLFWNLYDREKSFPTEKLKFFLLCLISDFLQYFFLFYNSV
jgi:hypothetical protein